MALSPGTRLGPYQIVSAIGSGGMGEVYCARDTRLDRTVAVKVLHGCIAADADQLRRFEQEARTLAALGHANIVAVHDVGTHDGSPYLVSEFLEGETLRQRLEAGPLPQRKATEYACEIARGLAAAHEKGIVHRDLKPENVFLTRDGRLKILDFGLAKISAAQAAAAGQGATVSHTAVGVVMGTVGYMSPEQVRGQAVDHRSDIFSFGATLYEMLSGKQAFKRESSIETMNGILKEDPPELTNAGLQVSAALERIVRRCLEKEPAERFQSARDLAFALDTVSGTTSTMPDVAQPDRRPWRTRFALVFIAAIAVIATAAALWFASRQPPPPKFRQLTYRLGMISSARFAPDGETVIYGAAWSGRPVEMFTTRIDGAESRSMDLPSADVLGISRNGQLALLLGRHRTFMWITEGTLARVPLAGGGPREILENVTDGDISPDGSQLAVVRQIGPMQRLEWPLGKTVYETHGYVSDVRFSPRGDSIAFVDHPVYGDDTGTVALIDNSGKKRTLSNNNNHVSAAGLAWVPSTGEVWFSTRQGISAVTLSGNEREVLSLPFELTLQDVSREGRVLLASVYTRSRIFGVTSEGQPRELGWTINEDIGGLAENGHMLAITTYDAANYSLLARRTDGSPPVRLGEGAALAVSPDGRWVASRLPSDPHHIVLSPTGVGEPRTLDLAPIEASLRYELLNWTREGLVFTGTEPGSAERGYLLDTRTGKLRSITPTGVQRAFLSPTGKLVFGFGTDLAPAVYPLDGGTPIPVEIGPNDSVVGWHESGENLYVWSGGQFPARIFLLNVFTGQRTLWKEITPPDPTGVLFGRMLITPDGNSYVYRYRQWFSDLYVVEGLK